MGIIAVVTGLDVKCPICNAPVKDFQTGDVSWSSGMVHFANTTSFVGWCGACDTRVDFSLKSSLKLCQAVVLDDHVRKVTIADYDMLVQEGKPPFTCKDCETVNPEMTLGQGDFVYCNACGASYTATKDGKLELRMSVPKAEREAARRAAEGHLVMGGFSDR